MIICNASQGSEQWLKDRSGIPSTSEFSKIITLTGLVDKQPAYMNMLLAEWLIGGPVDNYQSEWMLRGNEVEEEARDYYSLVKGEVEQTGFIFKDEKKFVGSSPDGLVAEDGLLEIKCPKASTMIDIMLNGLPLKYKPQYQGQLWVTGRKWVDVLAYHPGMKPVLNRFNRDESYILKMEGMVNRFIENMLSMREQLK